LTGEEQRQCSRAAAEGAGKEVQGAPGVSVELGAVTGSLERDRVAFHDSSTMAKWGGGLLLLRAARGGGEGGGNDGCDSQRDLPTKLWADKAVAALRTQSA
jgi:hypothetical protein